MNSAINIADIEKTANQLSVYYSELYLLLANLFSYPDQEVVDAINDGAVADKLQALTRKVAPEMVDDINWTALKNSGEADNTLQVDYTGLFDISNDGAPRCSLYGGDYIGGSRMKTMEDVVRFYNHFGLTMSNAPRELPDHIITELEFMHYLSFNEAECLRDGEDADGFRRAQRDFLGRHLKRWIPELGIKMVGHNAPEYLIELAGFLEKIIKLHSRHLESLVGTAAIKGSQDPVIIYSSQGG